MNTVRWRTCNVYNSPPEKNSHSVFYFLLPQLFPGSILLPPVNGVEAPAQNCQIWNLAHKVCLTGATRLHNFNEILGICTRL